MSTLPYTLVGSSLIKHMTNFTINLDATTYFKVYCTIYKEKVHKANSVLEKVTVVWILRFSYSEC
jgi:hypothetical protein